MDDERHAPAEAIELEEAFPVSYSIFAMARSHRAIAGAGLARLGLFTNQEVVLIQLAASDGLAQKTLAETLRVSHATIAKSVARLEKSGLVERRASERDGRVSLVFLTPAGRALHDHVVAVWRGLEELATRDLSPTEQRAYLRAVAKIRHSMEDREAAIET